MRSVICAVVAMVAATLLSGCAVATHIDPQTAAAAEVANQKSFNSPVTIEYAFQPSDLDVTVEVTGNVGSACSFPLTLSQPFYITFASINQQAFRNLVASNAANAYKVRVELDSFDNSVMFAQRFFGSTAIAHSEIALHVSVFAPGGHELARQLIRGSGQQRVDVSSCTGASEAVQKAVDKALRQVAEEYADRIVNALSIP